MEITRVVDGRAKLQPAVDAGALAGAGMSNTASNAMREDVANKVVQANLQVGRGLVPSSLAIVPSFALADRVTLDAEIRSVTILGKSMFGGFHTIKVSSTAQKATAGTPGTAAIPLPNCPAQPTAIDAPAQVLPPPPVPAVPPTPLRIIR